MSKANTGGQAFPVPWPDTAPTMGMTVRQLYAGLALMGRLAGPESESTSHNEDAKVCVLAADALIAGLGEKEPGREARMRSEFRNVFCILRSLDVHEIDRDAAGFEFEGDKFLEDPHTYLIQCPDRVADAIWAAVERRM